MVTDLVLDPLQKGLLHAVIDDLEEAPVQAGLSHLGHHFFMGRG